jgi:hypothetical protein
MTLQQCPSCDNRVSSEAESCPHCGHPIKAKPVATQNGTGLGFWEVVGIVVLSIIILSLL